MYLPSYSQHNNCFLLLYKHVIHVHVIHCIAVYIVYVYINNSIAFFVLLPVVCMYIYIYVQNVFLK